MQAGDVGGCDFGERRETVALVVAGIGEPVTRLTGGVDDALVGDLAPGRGAGFGPELTAIGARRSVAFLRQAILKPTSTLPDGFLYVSAVPAAGAAVRGIRVNEDSFSIQLRDAGGRFYSFRKSELKELHRLERETPMPSYEGRISSAALDDLVAYVAGLKGTP